MNIDWEYNISNGNQKKVKMKIPKLLKTKNKKKAMKTKKTKKTVN